MKPSRYAVFGQPIGHSLSPRIHEVFAQQVGISLSYEAIESSVGGLKEALAEFVAAGGVGANITLPLKQAAFALCEVKSEHAQRAGAVNTLVRNGDEWDGHNTDGLGLVRDLTARHGLDLRARRTLLVGAGGAAHGVAPALLDAGVSELIIVNRSPERADALMDQLGEPARAFSRYWDDVGKLGDFELIVNATSAGRDDGKGFSLPFSLSNQRTLAVDLNYGEAAIAFTAWARAAQCRAVVDGIGMLVEQAAISFELWHGVHPDTAPVYEALREHQVLLKTAD